MSGTSRQRTAKQGASQGGVQSSEAELATGLPKAPPGFAELQAALQKAMEEMSKFSGTLSALQADVTSVQNDQAQTKSDVASILQRLTEAEDRISQLEDERKGWKQLAETSAKECAQIRETVSGMINREKRLNVRIFGLKEQKESQTKLSDRVLGLFADALGVTMAKSELQMVHRVPSEGSDESNKPSPVIVRFQSFLEKQRVMTAVKSKARFGNGISWENSNISVFPDMTKEVADKRKQFTDVRKKLHDLDTRFTLAFPATLRFTWKGKKVSFTDPNKAMALLNEERAESGANADDIEQNQDST